MTGMQFRLPDGTTLGIAHEPSFRKSPYLYHQEGGVEHVLAYFRSEATAQIAIDWLHKVAAMRSA